MLIHSGFGGKSVIFALQSEASGLAIKSDADGSANKPPLFRVAFFITPIKYARTEGLQIYLYPMGNHIKQTLRGHCDYVLK